MTLIASTLNHKMPIIISDLLWSGDHTPEPVRFPTNNFDPTPYLPEDQEAKPVKLGQKMYFINDKTCIVFAGMSDEIIVLLTVFKNTFKDKGPLSMQEIKDFLEAYELHTNFSNSAFFITHIDHEANGSVNVSQYYCPKTTHTVDPIEFTVEAGVWNVMPDPNYDKVSACGSGAEGFLNMVKQVGTVYSSWPEGDFMRAVQTNTGLISKLLTMERVSLYTLKENWGGGFEMAYYNGSRFQKIDKIAYVINHSQFDDTENVELPIPRLIMHYQYINDILYILALEVHKYAIDYTEMHTIFTAGLEDFHGIVYEVEGADVENIEVFALPSDFSFETDKISMGYSIITKENGIYNPAFFNLGPEVTVKFEQDKGLTVAIANKIIEDVKNKSRDAILHQA